MRRNGTPIPRIPWTALLLLASCRMADFSAPPLDGKGGTAAAPGCASCHPYPPSDVHHDFHVFFKAYYLRAGRSYTTCRDCHVNSVRGDTLQVHDTVFGDPSTFDSWSSWLDPEHPRGTDPEILQVRILDYLRALPVGPEPEPLRQHPFREYRTGPAHLNGSVDVAFDAWVGDAEGGRPAVFDARLQTCSAVACHADDREYRWAAPSKGLGPLRGAHPAEP